MLKSRTKTKLIFVIVYIFSTFNFPEFIYPEKKIDNRCTLQTGWNENKKVFRFKGKEIIRINFGNKKDEIKYLPYEKEEGLPDFDINFYINKNKQIYIMDISGHKLIKYKNGKFEKKWKLNTELGIDSIINEDKGTITSFDGKILKSYNFFENKLIKKFIIDFGDSISAFIEINNSMVAINDGYLVINRSGSNFIKCYNKNTIKEEKCGYKKSFIYKIKGPILDSYNSKIIYLEDSDKFYPYVIVMKKYPKGKKKVIGVYPNPITEGPSVYDEKSLVRVLWDKIYTLNIFRKFVTICEYEFHNIKNLKEVKK